MPKSSKMTGSGKRYHACVDCGIQSHPDEMFRVRVKSNFGPNGGDGWRFVCLRCSENRKDDAAIFAAELAKSNVAA